MTIRKTTCVDTRRSLDYSISLLRNLLLIVGMSICSCYTILAQRPTSPEFSTFQTASSAGVDVNKYTGDVSYSIPVIQIPGPDGASYALSLSYSNVLADQEASWVGYGWTLNPGSITREKVGFPDELRGAPVKIWNKAPVSNTFSVGAQVGFEAFGFPLGGLSSTLGYNNYSGFFLSNTLNAKLGFLEGSITFDNGDQPLYSFSLDPALLLNQASGAIKNDKFNKYYSPIKKMFGSQARRSFSNFSSYDRSMSALAFPEKSYAGFSITGSLSVQGDPLPFPVGLDGGVHFSFSRQGDPWLLDVLDLTEDFRQYNAFGYMYLADAKNDQVDLMDFDLDMDGIYSRRSRFLPVPIANADIFTATGEGISGGFRLHNKGAGHFRKPSTSSSTQMFNLEVDVHVGMNTGIGGAGGVGFTDKTTGEWQGDHLTQYRFLSDADGIDEPYFFSFLNDPAGTIDFGDVANAALKKSGDSFEVKIPSSTMNSLNPHNRVLRSSYIGYHTNSEVLQFLDMTSERFHYKSSAYSHETETQINRGSLSPDAVGEFAIYNNEGHLYTYSYPLLASNDKSFSINVRPNGIVDQNQFARFDMFDIAGIKSKVNGKATVLQGMQLDAPFAVHWLLTSITTPEYVDLTKNGPTPDDLGAYVTFTYDENVQWHHWRQPVAGLNFQVGDLSTPKDDMGSFASGNKQVTYPREIHTKTHYARFITSERDEYEAPADHTSDTWDWREQLNTTGLARLKKLDKIELYLKAQGQEGDKLLQTVYFQYEQEAQKKLARGTLTAPEGRLTLKRVWFELADIKNPTISPYEFDYTYPSASDFAQNVQQQYPDIVNYGDQFAEQNEEYTPFNVDAWGYFDVDDPARKSAFKSWKDQTPDITKDPAMWQLKRITLPTGGQYHIQYEPDDYRYVQDKAAQAMVAIRSNPDYSNKFYVDIEGDLDLSAVDYPAYKSYLEEIFKNEKIYYRYLYSLATDRTPQLDHCDAEYVDGYVDVSEVGYDENGFFITLATERNPKSVCQEMVKAEKNGMLIGGAGSDCLVLSEQLSMDQIGEGGNLKQLFSVAHQLMNRTEIALKPQSEFCNGINFALSYLRLPVLKRKMGGGLRVKRLLTYEPGFEGLARLTGTENFYEENIDGTMVSTGVAANEPGEIGEENGLLNIFDDLGTGYSLTEGEEALRSMKMISGAEKDRREGPVGRSMLPSPSVGYSKIFSRNINQNEKAFSVTEYLTARSYPFKAEFTNMNRERKIVPPVTTLGFHSESREWVSQAYTFTQVQAAGKLRRASLMKGDLSNPGSAITATSTEIEYYEPGAEIPQSLGEGSEIAMSRMGNMSEAVFFSRAMLEKSKNGKIGFDMTIGIAPPIFIPYPIPAIQVSSIANSVHQHVASINKNLPLLPRYVKENQNGVVSKTENVAFDLITGSPSIVRTYDEYDKMQVTQTASPHNGSITSKTSPAYNAYPEVGAKSENERAKLNYYYSSVRLLKPASDDFSLQLTSPGVGPAPCEIRMQEKIVPGDLIEVKDANGNLELYNVSETVTDGIVVLLPLTDAAAGSYDLIADDTPVEAQVVKSGKTNQLSNSVGNIVLYGEELEAQESPSLAAMNALVELLNQTVAQEAVNVLILGNQLPQGIKLTLGMEPCMPLPPDVKFIFNTGDNEASVSCSQTTLPTGTSVPNGMSGGVVYSFLINVPVGTTFGFNPNTGKMVYYLPDEAECPRTIECFTLCSDNNVYTTKDRVLSISALTLSDEWPQSTGSVTNPYETGERGRWRPRVSYGFWTNDIVGGNNAEAGERAYKNAGTYTAKLFNRDNTWVSEINGWLPVTKIDKYNASGNVEVQRDAQGISSVVAYDYKKLLPIWAASNAKATNVMVENCENILTNEDGDIEVTESWLSLNPVDNYIDESAAHTGKKSIRVIPHIGTGEIDINGAKAKFDPQLMKGYSVRMWIKINAPVLLEKKIWLVNMDGTKKPFTTVSGKNEWKLVEIIMTQAEVSGFANGTQLFDKIEFSGFLNNPSVDDIVIKPLDATVMAYVYDPLFMRLSEELDDTNFAKFYRYGASGNLTSIQIETVDGVVTSRESYLHMPAKNREE